MTATLFLDLWPALAPFLEEYGWDALAALGLVLLEAGIAAVSPCAALVVLGLVLLALGLWGARAWASTGSTPSS